MVWGCSMSKSSELRRTGPWRVPVMLTIALTLVCAATTSASDESVDAVTGRGLGAKATDAVKPRSASAHAADERPTPALGRSPKSERSLLRCWQDGQMVFEGRGYGAMPQSQIAAELRQGEGAAGRIQVLDLYQGLCVLELPK